MERETKRKIVHIGMVGWAFLIGRISPVFISGLALAALLFNLLLLPRITGRSLERKEERTLGFSPGMIAYPAVVFLLSLIFFHSQVFLAVAWGAMAFGDGFATVVGKKYGRHPVGSLSGKTWEGTLAFVVAGIAGTVILVFSLPPEVKLGLPAGVWVIVIVLAVLLSAASEILRGTVNDNIMVPLTAAFTAFLAVRIFLSGQFFIPGNWWVGLLFVVLLVVLSYLSGRFDLKGALTGGGITALVFLGGGMAGLLFLFIFVVGGVAGSGWRIRDKIDLGLAQENRNRRSAIHVVANGSVPAMLGILAWVFPLQRDLYMGMTAAALASALADTWSSELGNVYGKEFVNIVSLQPDIRGRDGVISLQGSLAGVAGSCVMATGYWLYAGSVVESFIILLAGVMGNFLDSVLGATLQRRGYMTNHSVNLVNTLFAALLFMYLYTIK
ncbi:MAG TPA: DUF92 domain-containing protein [Bacteroidetes bacterium]|nr:DUF92 domain-containing protein [Bacteroidota bacterium]